jgi:hypothetical protein
MSLVRLAIGWRGWFAEAAATPNWGTRIAALPRAGQARVGRGRVVVVVGATVVVVVSPGYVVVVDVEVVVVLDVEVVVVPAIAAVGLVPTMRATTTAPTPSTEIVTRHNFAASE